MKERNLAPESVDSQVSGGPTQESEMIRRRNSSHGIQMVSWGEITTKCGVGSAQEG